jgi:CHAT domain-containing protein
VPLDKEKGQKNLTELIWKPILPYLKEGCTIYYAPSGKLHRINLEAISIDKNQAMLDVYNMVSLQSTRQLIQQGTSNRILTNALLMGGISYSKNENFVSADTSNKNQSSENSSHTDQNRGFNYAAMDTIYNSKVSWKELTFTGKEVDNIATTLQKKNINYILKKEQEATEDNFKKICKATSPSIIHLSTHGYFFPDQNEKRSDLNIDEPIYKMSDHSLIRSGLILAGGNDAWQGYVDNTAEEDGILTSLEISNMDLSNTELVVLSACDTGLGDIKGSEGVFGLQRAFKSAGAKYLIMSLWQIPDKQTSKLMTLFYQKWLDDNMSIPDAFHAAQKQMKDDGFDPYQWAGFVLIQ